MSFRQRRGRCNGCWEGGDEGNDRQANTDGTEYEIPQRRFWHLPGFSEARQNGLLANRKE